MDFWLGVAVGIMAASGIAMLVELAMKGLAGTGKTGGCDRCRCSVEELQRKTR